MPDAPSPRPTYGREVRTTSHEGRVIAMDLHDDRTPRPAEIDMVVCPECAAPALVEWREPVASTDGSTGLAKIRCLNRHWFMMPGHRLVASAFAGARSHVQVSPPGVAVGT